MNRIRQKFFNT